MQEVGARSGAAGNALTAELAKLLIANNLQTAEVVELADTPSTRIALDILYKLLIISLLPFTSMTSDNVPRNGQ